MTDAAGMLYAAPVAAEEPREALPAEPDAPTSHDGEGESDAGGTAPSSPASDEPTATVRDLLAEVEATVGEMVTALDGDGLSAEDGDRLLDKAHAIIVGLLDGPKCPMCDGGGVLATDPPADPRAERCEDCHGMGTVFTGSRVPESAVRPCGRCGGKGFNDLADVTALPPTTYVPPQVPIGAQWYDADDPGTWHLPLDPAKRGQHVG